MVYSAQGGTTTESVTVQASRRRALSLTRDEVLDLGRMGLAIEEHYGQAMDIEWAKDGRTGDLFIVQARPETVHVHAKKNSLERYVLDPQASALKTSGARPREGTGRRHAGRIGPACGSTARTRRSSSRSARCGRCSPRAATSRTMPVDERVFDPGDVLVTEMTTPDWEPMMKEASLIVTERGGRTSHAAIIAREFGIPAIVGCEGATKAVEAAHGSDGLLRRRRHRVRLPGPHPVLDRDDRHRPDDAARDEDQAQRRVPGEGAAGLRCCPSDGVGLARIEFILTSEVGIHPLALLFREELGYYVETGKLSPELEVYASGSRGSRAKS